MSKKEIDFEKLEPKKQVEPQKLETEIDTEVAVAMIHEEQIEKEKVKRVTVDLPFSLFVSIKKKIVSEEKTLKDYFIELAKQDLFK